MAAHNVQNHQEGEPHKDKARIGNQQFNHGTAGTSSLRSFIVFPGKDTVKKEGFRNFEFRISDFEISNFGLRTDG